MTCVQIFCQKKNCCTSFVSKNSSQFQGNLNNKDVTHLSPKLTCFTDLKFLLLLYLRSQLNWFKREFFDLRFNFFIFDTRGGGNKVVKTFQLILMQKDFKDFYKFADWNNSSKKTFLSSPGGWDPAVVAEWSKLLSQIQAKRMP